MSEKNRTPKILVVLGPTASGKSDLGVELAIKFNGEIISADSRQVYQGLDIGTGKITREEMKAVPHHLLDVSSPEKVFTVSDFKRLGEEAINQILERGNLPIICGGTGFYIEALLGETLIPEVPPNPELRKELEEKTIEELFKILKKLDPERASAIDAKNKRRLVRAIEICKELGEVPKIPNNKSQITNKFQILKIGIKITDEELRERINKRIEKWFEKGLLEEVKNLHNQGLSWERMSEIGLEYSLVAEFLKNQKLQHTSEVSKATFDTSELKKKMAEKTWQYAKRQMTWFKRDTEIKWFNLSKVEGFETQNPQIEKEVERFLEI